MRKLVGFVGALLLIMACGSQDKAQPAQIVTPVPQPPPVQAEAPLTDRIKDPTFELALAPTGPYEATKPGNLALTLTPRGIYHINQDYPVAVSVSPTAGVTFPKAELRKDDLAEMGDKLARFEVPFTAAAPGDYRVETNVRFAVCTDENCVPDERKLALTVTVR